MMTSNLLFLMHFKWDGRNLHHSIGIPFRKPLLGTLETKSLTMLIDTTKRMSKCWTVFKVTCHTQIKRGSPIVDPTVEVQSRKTEVVLITIQYKNIIII